MKFGDNSNSNYHIPGYSGYIPKIKAENVFGMTLSEASKNFNKAQNSNLESDYFIKKYGFEFSADKRANTETTKTMPKNNNNNSNNINNKITIEYNDIISLNN